MKILEINAYYNYGSTGHIVKDLCEEGIRNGHEMYAIYWLLYDRSVRSERVIFCGEAKEPSSSEKIIQWVINGGKLNYNTKRTRVIIDQIKRIDPDIIHIHNLHGDFEYGSINVELLLSAISEMGSKVIWTLHDCWPITGRCFYFSHKKCEKWKHGCGRCPQRIYDREGIFIDYSKKNWEKKNSLYKMIEEMTIVTVSNWLNNIVKDSMLKDRRVVTIYNGVDTDVFSPEYQRRECEKYQILCIGWDRRKGYKDYFKLASLLEDDEEIVVVGKRPVFRRFRRMPGKIREIDRATTKANMAYIYRSANVYFNASPAETFGLTTVEAMSCGIPVVGYDNTATTELIKQIPEGGTLVPDGSVADVKSAIVYYKNNPIDRNLVHNKCQQLFDYSLMMRKYMELYNG